MDLSELNEIMNGRSDAPYTVMEVLQDVQEKYRYLSEESLKHVSEAFEVPLIEVFRLANFYKAFSLDPRGRHLVTVCSGTACHVQGAPRFVDELLGQLEVKPGQTTKDGAFTVEVVNCLGACSLAPLVIVDGKYYGQMTPSKLRREVERIQFDDELEDEEPKETDD